MPWDKRKAGNKWEVVKEGTDEVVGTHDTESGADDQIAALNANVKETANLTMRMVDVFEVVNDGQPIRVLPLGTWYRDGRKLELTEDRLQEIVKHFKDGLPRYKVGIDLDHAEVGGKVGDVEDLEFLEDDAAPKGPGVYVTKYDLTEKGVKAVKDDGYDAVSAEVMWSLLNEDSKYEDPTTGEMVDNVLTGLALTPRPFFGHKEVAIFSAGLPKKVVPTPERAGPTVRILTDRFEGSLDDVVQGVREAFDPVMNPDHPGYNSYVCEVYDDHVIVDTQDGKYYQADYTMDGGTVRPAPRSEWVEVEKRVEYAPKQEEIMSEKTPNAEEFAAKVKDAERLAAENQQLQDKLMALQAEREAEKLAARKAALVEEAKGYEHMSVEVTEYAEKFAALEAADPTLADWFRSQFKAHDKAVELGTEVGTDAEGIEDPAAKFLAAVDTIQKAENLSYEDALAKAGRLHPTLADAYAGTKQEG